MKKTIQTAQWQSNGKYTKQTKTLWTIASIRFDVVTALCNPYEEWMIDEIIEHMSMIGYTKLNRTSVKWYLGALNGRIIRDALKNNKSFQIEVNSFRKNMEFPTIKF
jgi:hypothetical protein